MTMLLDSLSGLAVSFGLSIVAKSTLVLLITLGALRLAHDSRASLRHLFLVAGFGMLSALPAAISLAPPVRVEVVPVPLMFEDYLSEAVSLDDHAPVAVTSQQGSASTGADPWNVTTPELLTAIWAGGVVLFGMPLFIGTLQVRRLRRTGLPWRTGQRLVDSLAQEAGLHRPIDVLLHESIAAPATCGICRRAVLFPINADTWRHADTLRAAVHEVEHARRADCLVNVIARAICAVYWFHPLAWIAWRRLVLEAERACDDAVLRRAAADAYAEQLVTLAGRLTASARHPLLAMANRSDLVQRVRAVLDQRQARGHAGTAAAVAIAIGASALIVTLSPLQAVSASSGVAIGQSATGGAPSQFEVATIRVNRSGERRARHSIVPAAGWLTITNVTVRDLIQEAYSVPLVSQLVNVPEWASTTRVDVVAKAESPAPVATLQRMLQPLLAEHFKLSVRREPRDMDVFAMVVANPGRLGPQLEKSDDPCDDIVGTAGGFARASEGAPNQKGTCGILPGGAGRIVARGLDMAGLAAFIGTAPGRMVIDRTGLTGRFDLDLTYTPSAFSAEALAQRPGATPPPGVDPSGPPLTTALREQLGLRLDPVRALVEVLVIERAEPLAVDQPVARAAAPVPQQPAPAFDVVSIRQNTSGIGAPTTRVEGGRYVASNAALQQLISDAYRLPIVGGPEWIRSRPGPSSAGQTRFDIIATIPRETPAAQVPLMVRTLLAERFKLAVHEETQERDVYALVHARDDKRLGPQLTPSMQQCPVEIEAGPLRAPVRRVTEDGTPVCSTMVGPAAIRGGGLTLRFLANAMTRFAGRMVVDHTGLEGPFDFELRYAPAAARGGGPPPLDDRPSIFVAVQEQLGLKLEPTTAPVEVLVVDTVSMPSEN
jgi:uncharacterized protein (TIGR03435 family)